MEMRLWKKEKYRFSYRILKKTVYENYQPLSWFTSSSQKPPKTNLIYGGPLVRWPIRDMESYSFY